MHDASPVCNERLGCREAKAAAAAGHDVDPVAQSEIHPVILPQVEFGDLAVIDQHERGSLTEPVT